MMILNINHPFGITKFEKIVQLSFQNQKAWHYCDPK